MVIFNSYVKLPEGTSSNICLYDIYERTSAHLSLRHSYHIVSYRIISYPIASHHITSHTHTSHTHTPTHIITYIYVCIYLYIYIYATRTSPHFPTRKTPLIARSKLPERSEAPGAHGAEFMEAPRSSNVAGWTTKPIK